MTLEELLKAQGLSEEQVKAVLYAMKENKIFTAGEENLDIRYAKLKEQNDSLTTQHQEAQTLIEQMKEASKGNEGLQSKIADYETQVAELQNTLAQTQINSAIKLALLEAKASDVDYMTFKLREKGELKLDEKGKLKDISEKIEGLKIEFPNQFENSDTKKKVDPLNLPPKDVGKEDEPMGLAASLKAAYEND